MNDGSGGMSVPRSVRVCAVLTLLAPGWVSVAFAQAPVSSDLAPYEPPASRANGVGLCQCNNVIKVVRRFCTSGIAACRAACGSNVASLMPLGYNALSACPPRELFVVLPNADGRPGSGAITVSGTNDGSPVTTLDRAYAAAADVSGGQAGAVSVTAEETGRIFKRALDARPALPRRFTLHFAPGSTRSPAAASPEFQALIKDIKSRPAYEIEVTGYTDTVADEPTNQKLSLERANAVAAALIRDGINKDAVSVTGYGKRFLAIDTGDNVSEERNRRVEVWVR